MTGNEASDRLPPSRLYKYRPPDLEKLADILLKNELWAAEPSTFNDPFDCFPHIDLRGTYVEALAYIDLRIARTGIVLSREKRRAKAREISKHGLGALSEETRGPGLWRDTIRRFGVVSLAVDPLDILMWGHYADHHRGVCLGFATDEHPLTLASEVRYDVERPTFRPLDPDRVGLMERILLRKARIWEYEHEWRYVRITDGAGATAFPATALRSIVLGAAIPKSVEREVRSLLARRQRPIVVERSVFDKKDFKLHRRSA